METQLLPLAKLQGKEFLVDIENREFRDFDKPDTVIKMHSPAGKELMEQINGTDWNSSGISTGRQDKLEV